MSTATFRSAHLAYLLTLAIVLCVSRLDCFNVPGIVVEVLMTCPQLVSLCWMVLHL